MKRFPYHLDHSIEPMAHCHQSRGERSLGQGELKQAKQDETE